MAEQKKNVNVSESVAQRISSMILSECRFRPGDRLPNERDFAGELGVSRTSIREAFKLLDASGTLEIRRGVGAFVRETPGIPSDPLGLAQTGDAEARIREWYEIRLVLEPKAVQWAASRATEEELSHLAELEQETASLIRLRQDVQRQDMRFHSALAKASGNEIFHRMATAIGPSVLRLEPSGASAEIEPHRDIVRFLLLRDGEGAALAARYHIKKEMKTALEKK